jgi:hypothetical protein
MIMSYSAKVEVSYFGNGIILVSQGGYHAERGHYYDGSARITAASCYS